MANAIIAIHGLGNKPPKLLLEKWWKMAIKEGLTKNGYKQNLPRFEMVYWADLMYDKPLDKSISDPKNEHFLDEPYVKAPEEFPVEKHETRKKVVSFLNKELNSIFLNDDYTLNYRFITDSIVSNYFKDLEAYYADYIPGKNGDNKNVREEIRTRLYNVLKKHKKDDIMLISHSMGSIIAFDVLTFMLPASRVQSFITIGSPLGLPIVVSKIAAEQQQKFHEPSHMVTPPGVLKHWYNYSDIMDKVAFNYKLADDFNENKKGITPVDFLVTNNYEINRNRNPHKSFGYLRTPEFANAMNSFMMSERINVFQRLFRMLTKTS